MATNEQIAIETEKLRRLEHLLGQAETAEWLYHNEPAALAVALKRVEEARDTEDNDPATIRGAMKIANEAGEPWRAKPIKLGVNKSKVRFNGVSAKPDAPTKSFNSVVNKSTNDFNKLTSEDETLPWIDPNARRNTKNKVAIIKDCVKRTIQARQEADPYKLNHVAEAILARKVLKVNESLTQARASIRAYPSNAEGSAKIPTRIPTDFDSVAQKQADTRARMPAEFAPKIEKTEDRSYAAIAKRTAAQKTIERPTKIDFVDQERDRQLPQVPEISPHIGDDEPSMAAQTYRNFPNMSKQWKVSLQSPAAPKQGFDPVNGAI